MLWCCHLSSIRIISQVHNYIISLNNYLAIQFRIILALNWGVRLHNLVHNSGNLITMLHWTMCYCYYFCFQINLVVNKVHWYFSENSVTLSANRICSEFQLKPLVDMLLTKAELSISSDFQKLLLVAIRSDAATVNGSNRSGRCWSSTVAWASLKTTRLKESHQQPFEQCQTSIVHLAKRDRCLGSLKMRNHTDAHLLRWPS